MVIGPLSSTEQFSINTADRKKIYDAINITDRNTITLEVNCLCYSILPPSTLG